MTKNELIAALNEISNRDPEGAHADADGLLLAYFAENDMQDVADAYDRLVERCAWWAWA